MKKFILLTVLFLGWGYYEMSGGADFVPEARPAPERVAQAAQPTRITLRDADTTAEAATPVISIEPTQTEPAAQAIATAPVTPSLPEVTSPPPDAEADPTFVSLAQPLTQTVRVTANSLNVRAGPSTGDPVVGRLTLGEEVSVALTDSGNGWTLIRVEGDGVEGWVSSRFLSR